MLGVAGGTIGVGLATCRSRGAPSAAGFVAPRRFDRDGSGGDDFCAAAGAGNGSTVQRGSGVCGHAHQRDRI